MAEIKRKKNRNRGSQAGKYPPTGNIPGQPLYRPELCDVVKRLGGAGKSETQMAVAIGVVRATIREWQSRYPEFGIAMRMAKEASLNWWEEKGQKSLNTIGFQSSLYNKIITCRFRDEYSEKTIIAGDPDAPLVTRIERVIVRPKTE